jgi:hypothetical protein
LPFDATQAYPGIEGTSSPHRGIAPMTWECDRKGCFFLPVSRREHPLIEFPYAILIDKAPWMDILSHPVIYMTGLVNQDARITEAYNGALILALKQFAPSSAAIPHEPFFSSEKAQIAVKEK